MSTPLFPTTVCLRLTLLGVAAIAAGCDSTDNPGGKGQVEDTGSGLTNSDDAPENTAPTAPEVRITPADPTTDVAGHCHRIRRRRRRPHHLPLRLVQRWHPVRGAHRGHGVRESVSRDGCDAVSSEYGVKSSSHGMYGGDGNSSCGVASEGGFGGGGSGASTGTRVASTYMRSDCTADGRSLEGAQGEEASGRCGEAAVGASKGAVARTERGAMPPWLGLSRLAGAGSTPCAARHWTPQVARPFRSRLIGRGAGSWQVPSAMSPVS